MTGATLISEVRRVFRGTLPTVPAGEDFEQIRFADALDVVGLNAYYPCTLDQAPLWRNTRRELMPSLTELPSVVARDSAVGHYH